MQQNTPSLSCTTVKANYSFSFYPLPFLSFPPSIFPFILSFPNSCTAFLIFFSFLCMLLYSYISFSVNMKEKGEEESVEGEEESVEGEES